MKNVYAASGVDGIANMFDAKYLLFLLGLTMILTFSGLTLMMPTEAFADSFTIHRVGVWVYTAATDDDGFTHGTLTRKKKSLYGGQVNDYRKTPWGMMYWLGDWPSRGWKISGWSLLKHTEWPDGNDLDIPRRYTRAIH